VNATGFFQTVGPNQALQVFGVRLVGITAANAKKLILTAAFLVSIWLVSLGLRALLQPLIRGRENKRVQFWTRQAIQLVTTALQIIGVISIWFDDPARLTTFLGLLGAGVAFASQKVITALAGYFVLLRGKTFNVGERIKMGGVRGDVISLGFIQTTIMEMGEPPSVQAEDPGMWVQARQYTGRIVTVTNDKIFQDPVYNYSRDFPFVWEEMRVGIRYEDDHARAEQILLATAQRHTLHIEQLSADRLKQLEERYAMQRSELEPQVFWRLTDNWVELSVRFIAEDHGIRQLKDRMSRDIVASFRRAGLSIASATYDIVGLPEIRIAKDPPV
jgi:small-conductance mechanosensitive channel